MAPGASREGRTGLKARREWPPVGGGPEEPRRPLGVHVGAWGPCLAHVTWERLPPRVACLQLALYPATAPPAHLRGLCHFHLQRPFQHRSHPLLKTLVAPAGTVPARPSPPSSPYSCLQLSSVGAWPWAGWVSLFMARPRSSQLSLLPPQKPSRAPGHPHPALCFLATSVSQGGLGIGGGARVLLAHCAPQQSPSQKGHPKHLGVL